MRSFSNETEIGALLRQPFIMSNGVEYCRSPNLSWEWGEGRGPWAKEVTVALSGPARRDLLRLTAAQVEYTLPAAVSNVRGKVSDTSPSWTCSKAKSQAFLSAKKTEIAARVGFSSSSTWCQAASISSTGWQACAKSQHILVEASA